MKLIFAFITCLTLVFLTACSSSLHTFPTGIDANYLMTMQRAGRTWSEADGQPADPLTLLHDAGADAIRLRLWVGDEGANKLDQTIALAKRARQQGLHSYLVIFLSDDWADFVKQPVPAVWHNLDQPALLAAVETYCRDVTQRFADEGITITTYEIGNEIDFGICGVFEGDWPKRVSREYLTQNLWPRMTPIIAAAQRGVRSANPDARFILHLAQWQSSDFCIAFARFMLSRGIQIDYLGLSYFPSSASDETQRTFAFLAKQLAAIAPAVDRPIIICESAYPSEPHFAGQFADWNKPAPGYPLTLAGQQRWLADYLAFSRSNPHLAGVYYWSPEWYDSDIWHAFALFNHQGRAKPALRSLR